MKKLVPRSALFSRLSVRAFTLVELLVVLVILGILVAIVLPVIGAVRRSAVRSDCSSNLRQVAMAYLLYGNDNGGHLPKKLSPQDPNGYSPNDVHRGTSLYLGATQADLHAPVELSPLAVRNDDFVNRFRSSTKAGFYTSVSYWPIVSVWKNTLYFKDTYSDRSPPRPLAPPNAAMLGVVDHEYAAANGSGVNANIYLWNSTPTRFEYYGGTATYLAFFDGHVASVEREALSSVINPKPVN